MTTTVNLGLPFIEGGQAQKHVTHNEALRILDAAVQIAVLDVTRTVPPVSPVDGQRHVVAAGATGAWSGHAKSIATWQDGAWAYLVPKEGWCAWSMADDLLLVFDGTLWRDLRGFLLDNAARVGINTTADSHNRLSVKANGVLLSHDDVTPGSGDMLMALNKALAARDAGVTFGTGFSPRALIGLLGDDDFAIKVSADGTTYRTALAVERASGQVNFAQSPKFQAYMNFDKYIPANTFMKVQFNATRHNDQSAFDTVNNRFVVPVAGYYALGYRVTFKANAALPTSMLATFYKTGVEIPDDGRVQTSAALVTNRTQLAAQAVLKLAAGDVIAVFVYMDGNDGYVAATQNSFYGHRIA